MSRPDGRHAGGEPRDQRDPLYPAFGAQDDDTLEEIPGATHWPEMPATDALAEWAELRAWVGTLQERFSHLDHHAIPHCWWRHNEHVEALSALRDHERSSFSDTAPATAPLEWFRALRDITALLRTWTSELSCGAVHQDPATRLEPVGRREWERFVQDDVERRRQREINCSTKADDLEPGRCADGEVGTIRES